MAGHGMARPLKINQLTSNDDKSNYLLEVPLPTTLGNVLWQVIHPQCNQFIFLRRDECCNRI